MPNQETLNLDDWRDIATGPHDASWVEVKMPNGMIWAAHWAEDLSGEEQPPFLGWFVFDGIHLPHCGYRQLTHPVSWRPINHYNIRRASGDVVCDRCHCKYYEHPTYRGLLDMDGHPFLSIDCDGTLLKL